MKRIVIFISLAFLFVSYTFADQTTYRYRQKNEIGHMHTTTSGEEFGIIVGYINSGDYRWWYDNIVAINETNRDMLFTITYQLRRESMWSPHKNKLIENREYHSEIRKVVKFVPANSMNKTLLEKNDWLDYSCDCWVSDFPDVKRLGNIDWGIYILDFDWEWAK